MRNAIPCQGRTASGGVCGNSASQSQPFCHQHRYQSAASCGGTSRLSAGPPRLAVQAAFDFSDELEIPAEPPVVIETHSPKGYDGKPDTMPRNAIFRNRKVRIVSYEGDNKFLVLDTDDSYRTVHRDNMTFLPSTPKKKQPTLI